MERKQPAAGEIGEEHGVPAVERKARRQMTPRAAQSGGARLEDAYFPAAKPDRIMQSSPPSREKKGPSVTMQ